MVLQPRAALDSHKAGICPRCGQVVWQVASATPELAMFQHLLWIHGEVDKEG